MSFIDSLKETLGAAPADGLVEDVVEETPAKAEDPTPAPVKDAKEGPEEPKEEPKEDPKEPVEESPEESIEEPKNQPDDTPLSKEEADDVSAKIIEEVISSQGKDTKKPENPVSEPKEARNEMRDIKFYNKISEKIYDFDRGLEMSPDLREWISGAIEDDRVLSVNFIEHVLPKILAKSPDLAEKVIAVAKSAEDNKYIPFKVFFINNVDNSDTNEYASFAEATKTIQKEIDLYGVDPLKVFKAFYRRVDADGNIGDKVSVETVEAYVDKFNGDKVALRKKLHLPKKEKAQPQPQNQPQKQGKNKGKKTNKTDNGGNAASKNAGGTTA